MVGLQGLPTMALAMGKEMSILIGLTITALNILILLGDIGILWIMIKLYTEVYKGRKIDNIGKGDRHETENNSLGSLNRSTYRVDQ